MTPEKWKKLTDNEKKAKVLELAGWKHIQWDGEDNIEDHAWLHPKRSKEDVPMPFVFEKTPDVLNDLNVMHEVLKKVPYKKQAFYTDALKYKIVNYPRLKAE